MSPGRDAATSTHPHIFLCDLWRNLAPIPRLGIIILDAIRARDYLNFTDLSIAAKDSGQLIVLISIGDREFHSLAKESVSPCSVVHYLIIDYEFVKIS